MIRDHFKVMHVDLGARQGRILEVDGRDAAAGGSGLAALLYGKFGRPQKPWDDPEQPLIFAIGPLTGYFPLMSKTVYAFRSPYHGQYAESHAGGRSALALRFADYDALMITGRAKSPCVVHLGARRLEIREAHFLWGLDAATSGKTLRRMFPGTGHRSIWRIGPAGEIGSAMACVNVDTYRHFGRLGGGAAMGVKNLKAIAVQGDSFFPLPEGKDYPALFEKVHREVTGTHMMSKYHSLGTPANLDALNELKSLPWRNLQQSTDPDIVKLTGQRFADDTLLRNAACAGCPVGCIHIGFVREKFTKENRYLYRQVAYDYEPIFSTGTMLGVTDPFQVLAIMDEVEKMGLDVISGGLALSWATEALQKGVVTEKETLLPLAFGDAEHYKQAVGLLGRGANEFWKVLGMGALKAGARYGGEDFACVLGQEMAGYATGELFYVSEALSFRHSHLDTAAYAWDQKHDDKDVAGAVDFLDKDEAGRAFLTSMVACLFARGVYTDATLAECLASLGYAGLAQDIPAKGREIQRLRWRTRLATGYDPRTVRIPKRYLEVETWKGKTDPDYLEALRQAYARRILELGAPEGEKSGKP